MSDYTIEEKPGAVVVINCPERLDTQNSEELKKILSSCTDKNIYRIVMNLSQTGFVNSSGLGAIVSRISVVRANGGEIKIVVKTPVVLELLKITNLNKILKCYKDVATAVASF